MRLMNDPKIFTLIKLNLYEIIIVHIMFIQVKLTLAL